MSQSSNSVLLFEHYKKELKRISWRIQYKERANRKREVSFGEDFHLMSFDFAPSLVDKVCVSSLLNRLSSPIGRKIIIGIYHDGKTESELGEELGISQQGVNKWKRKMLKELSQMLNLKN